MKNVKYRVYSENEWVYPDDEIIAFDEATLSLHTARGGNVMIQALAEGEIKKGDKVSISVCGANGVTVKAYQLVPVTVALNSAPKGLPNTTTDYEKVKDFVTRKAPFDVYDATAPLDEVALADGRFAFALRYTAARDAKVGTQNIEVTLKVNECTCTIPVTVNVHKAIIPELDKSELAVINWANDRILANECGGEYGGEKFFELYKQVLPHLVDIRNNHFSLFGSWDNEVDGTVVIRDENGKIVDFDLSILEKELKLAEEAGMTKLYGHYIAHWEHWNDVELQLLWDKKDKTRVTTNEAYRQIQIYFKRLLEMIERNGWQDKFIQPLVDEPQTYNVMDYRVLCGIVRQLYPTVVIHDPVEVVELGGAADIICVKQAYFEKFYEGFLELQKMGQRMTYYTCGYPAGPTMNRAIDLPVFVGRLSFWMCHRYGFEGFLHWGYLSRSGLDLINSRNMVPGNHQIVYLVDGLFWETVRSHNQRAGAEDWELLNIIKKNDEALAQKLIEKGCRTFDDYETDMNKVEAIRLEILECADKYFE